MANRSLSTVTLKEDEDTFATREALSSEELQRGLEKIIKILSVDNDKDVCDFGSLEGDQKLPPYDPFVKSTYTSTRPQFLRYRPSTNDDDEDLQEKYEGMERSQRSPCSKILILAVLFVFIVCISAWHSSKLYADLNLQALNEYVDGFGLSISENSEELDVPINEYTDELGLAWHFSKLYADELGLVWHSNKLYAGLNLQALHEYADEFGLLISQNSEELDLPINEYADELCLLINEETEESEPQIVENTVQFESTHNFVAHNTILVGLSGTLALGSSNHMEIVMSEENKGKEWVLDVLVSEDSKHLGVLDFLVEGDSKPLGAVSSSTTMKSLGSALLCAVTGALCCAAAVVIYWYKKRVTYACPKTSVKEIKAKRNNRTEQGPLKQLSKMQTKGSSVPSVQLLNECSPAQAVSSSGKKNINMWNDSSIPGNSFHIPNQEVRRKGRSASTTNKENMISGEIFLENSSHGSLTTMAKKDNDKKQQKVMRLRKSERILRCYQMRAVM